jgi:hypothetical protein
VEALPSLMEPATTRKHLPLRRLRQSRRFLRHIHRSSISQQPKTVGQMGTGLATLSNGIDEYWQITAIKVELESALPRLHSHDGRRSRFELLQGRMWARLRWSSVAVVCMGAFCTGQHCKGRGTRE